MVEYNPGTNWLDFGWPWRKLKVTRGQKVKMNVSTSFQAEVDVINYMVMLREDKQHLLVTK